MKRTHLISVALVAALLLSTGAALRAQRTVTSQELIHHMDGDLDKLVDRFARSLHHQEEERLGQNAVECHKEQNQGKVKLIPIMLRPCDIDSHIVPNEKYKISDFQGLPKNMIPIIKWETHEDGWIDVVNGLKRVIDLIRAKK